MALDGAGENRNLEQLDVRCVDAESRVSALSRRRAHSHGDGEREHRDAADDAVRFAQAGARLRLEGVVVEFPRAVAGRRLDDREHRRLSGERVVGAALGRGADAHDVARELLEGERARGAGESRGAAREVAGRISDSDAAARSVIAAHGAAHSAARAGRDSSCDRAVRRESRALLGGHVRGDARPAVRRIREGAARESALSRSARVSGRSAEGAVRCDGADAAAVDGRRRDRGGFVSGDDVGCDRADPAAEARRAWAQRQVDAPHRDLSELEPVDGRGVDALHLRPVPHSVHDDRRSRGARGESRVALRRDHSPGRITARAADGRARGGLSRLAQGRARHRGRCGAARLRERRRNARHLQRRESLGDRVSEASGEERARGRERSRLLRAGIACSRSTSTSRIR